MKSKSDQVLQNLPEHWQAFGQQLRNNQSVREIFADYNAVLATIHGIKRLPGSVSDKHYKKYQALFQLLEELEKEITELLSCE